MSFVNFFVHGVTDNLPKDAPITVAKSLDSRDYQLIQTSKEEIVPASNRNFYFLSTAQSTPLSFDLSDLVKVHDLWTRFFYQSVCAAGISIVGIAAALRARQLTPYKASSSVGSLVATVLLIVSLKRTWDSYSVQRATNPAEKMKKDGSCITEIREIFLRDKPVGDVDNLRLRFDQLGLEDNPTVLFTQTEILSIFRKLLISNEDPDSLEVKLDEIKSFFSSGRKVDELFKKCYWLVKYGLELRKTPAQTYRNWIIFYVRPFIPSIAPMGNGITPSDSTDRTYSLAFANQFTQQTQKHYSKSDTTNNVEGFDFDGAMAILNEFPDYPGEYHTHEAFMVGKYSKGFVEEIRTVVKNMKQDLVINPDRIDVWLKAAFDETSRKWLKEVLLSSLETSSH